MNFISPVYFSREKIYLHQLQVRKKKISPVESWLDDSPLHPPISLLQEKHSHFFGKTKGLVEKKSEKFVKKLRSTQDISNFPPPDVARHTNFVTSIKNESSQQHLSKSVIKFLFFPLRKLIRTMVVLKEKIAPLTLDELSKEINNSADISRSTWGARDPDLQHLVARERPITKIVITTYHWDPDSSIRSETDPIKQKEKSYTRMREVQNKFISKNYGDLFCHAVVLYNGTVAAGRPAEFKNSLPQEGEDYIIFLFGNLEKQGKNDEPTDKQLRRAVSYVAELLIRLKLPLSAVIFTNEKGITSNVFPDSLDRSIFLELLKKEYNEKKFLEEIFLGKFSEEIFVG